MPRGIIIDDAILVGEAALAHHQMSNNPAMAYSLTTAAASLRLLLLGSTSRNILSATPTVIVTMIPASVVNSVLVMPGHLRHPLLQMHKVRPDSARPRLEGASPGPRRLCLRRFRSMSAQRSQRICYLVPPRRFAALRPALPYI